MELVPRRPTQQNQLPVPVAQTRTADDGTYELHNLRPGEYHLGINLAHTPSADMPYTRYFYPGTEDPAQSAVAMVAEHAGTVTYDFPIPAPLKPQLVEGFVYEPNLQPVEKAQIMVEDTRWLWQTNRIAATTDANGHFEISVYDGTAYRIHAVTMARFTNQSLSAEPFISAPALASVNLSG